MTLNKKQKVVISFILIAIAIIVWQIDEMFFSASNTKQSTPIIAGTTSQITPLATPTPHQPKIAIPQAPVAIEAPQKMNAPLPVPATHQPTLSVEAPLTQNQAGYLRLSHKYQMLTTTSQNDSEKLNQDYRLMHIEHHNGEWSASVNAEGVFQEVKQYSTLRDGSRVIKIDSNGIILQRSGKTYLLNFSGLALMHQPLPLMAQVPPVPQTEKKPASITIATEHTKQEPTHILPLADLMGANKKMQENKIILPVVKKEAELIVPEKTSDSNKNNLVKPETSDENNTKIVAKPSNTIEIKNVAMNNTLPPAKTLVDISKPPLEKPEILKQINTVSLSKDVKTEIKEEKIKTKIISAVAKSDQLLQVHPAVVLVQNSTALPKTSASDVVTSAVVLPMKKVPTQTNVATPTKMATTNASSLPIPIAKTTTPIVSSPPIATPMPIPSASTSHQLIPIAPITPAAPKIELTAQQRHTLEVLNSVLKSKNISSTSNVPQGQVPSEDEKKLLALANNEFTLQLTSSNNVNDLTSLVNAHHLQNQSYIFHTTDSAKDLYVLVYGDFKTQEQALASIRKLPLAIQNLKPWVRTIGSAQKAIQLGEKA